MGELIKTLGELELGGQSFRIELNHSTSGQDEKEIHIQNDKLRFALPEAQFLQMCAAILLAEKQMEQIKGADEINRLREGG